MTFEVMGHFMTNLVHLMLAIMEDSVKSDFEKNKVILKHKKDV